MMATVLCVEVAGDRDALMIRLRQLGHTPIEAPTLADVDDALRRHSVDLIAAAESMAGPIAALAARSTCPDFPPVLALRPHARSTQGLDAPRPKGAIEVLTTPLRRETVRMAIDLALEHRGPAIEGAANPRAETEVSLLVGQSAALRIVLADASSHAHRDVPVLIVGETGVGKSILARQVHARSARRNRPVVVVSCGASPAPRVHEILFGADTTDVEGSETPCAVHRARHGSLLLEAITELDACAQSRLMAELSQVRPDPRSHVVPRLIATADVGVNEAPERWQESLLATRMSLAVLRIPPLRERLEDLPILVGHFVHDMAARLGIRAPEVLPEALAELERRGWPGNVRELRNVVERAVIVGRSRPIDGCAFAAPPVPPSAHDPLRRARVYNLRRIERAAILAALRESSGHQGRAARLLGISTRTLRRRLQDRTWAIESARRVRRRPLAAVGTTSPQEMGSGRRGPGATSIGDRDRTRERVRPHLEPSETSRSRSRTATPVAKER